MNKGILRYKKTLALGLSAVVFLGGVAIVQNLLSHQNEPFEDESVVKVEDTQTTTDSKETKETLKAPVKDGIGIVRYYYSQDDDPSKQEQSLILFEGVYRPNQGIDYANKNETFDVFAAMSGTITKKTNDPILGWTVTITNDQKVSTTYQSLSDVKVKMNQIVKQGDLIGQSGENVYEADLKNHLHFILQKDEKMYNPEKFMGQQLDSIQ